MAAQLLLLRRVCGVAPVLRPNHSIMSAVNHELDGFPAHLMQLAQTQSVSPRNVSNTSCSLGQGTHTTSSSTDTRTASTHRAYAEQKTVKPVKSTTSLMPLNAPAGNWSTKDNYGSSSVHWRCFCNLKLFVPSDLLAFAATAG